MVKMRSRIDGKHRRRTVPIPLSTSLRDTQAGGVEDVHVLSCRNERHAIARRRRFATANLGNEQPVVDATHMGEGGFAKPFDQFDDAFGDERTVCSSGKMLRTD